jgi:hypothetical protein
LLVIEAGDVSAETSATIDTEVLPGAGHLQHLVEEFARCTRPASPFILAAAAARATDRLT